MQSGTTAPQPQSSQVTAQQQTASNVNTAIANATLGNTNQVTPQGNLTYTQTGGQQVGDNWVPQYTATQTLSPDQQRIYDQTTSLQNSGLNAAQGVFQQLNNTVQSPLNFDNAPALPTDQTAATNTAYNQLMSRQNQNFQLQTDQQKTQLANQGISAGSAAYDNALRPIEQAQTDAVNQAQLNATSLAGENLSQAQTLRNQAINEDQTLRNQPFQEYSQLLGLGGNIQSPTYAPGSAGTVAPTDVAGINAATNAAQLQQYQIQAGQSNALMGGLFGLGGSALGAGGTILGASLFA